MGPVSKYLCELIANQVDEKGLVVWYDPEKAYGEIAKSLELPNTTVLLYEGSFLQLRWEIDQRKLMDGEVPPRLVVYVPMAQEETHHALIELEAAGVVIKPGQQPPSRNTRLALIARKALKDVLQEDAVKELEKQTEAGKLTIAELDKLAEKGGQRSKGVLTIIFDTGNPHEIALSFLNSDQFDDNINNKEAKCELIELLRNNFGYDGKSISSLFDIRQSFARHVLMTELITCLGEAIPTKLASVPVASTKASAEACIALAQAWRRQYDMKDSYVAFARRIEQEIGLSTVNFDPRAIERIETFQAVEEALLRHAENRLLEGTDGTILNMAEARLSSFWCKAEPRLQAHWALIANAAKVFLEADRVEQDLKKTTISGYEIIGRYAEDPNPWCLLDTYYRHMESQWHNFEAYSEDSDSIEKLVIKARQRYMEVSSDLAKYFITQLPKIIQDKKVLCQSEVFEKYVKPSLNKNEKIAYVWVDALRFEMARELTRLLKDDFQVEINVALAAVPTITEIGMAALLPGAHTAAKVISTGDGKIALEVCGTLIKDRKDRVAFLRVHSGVKVFDIKLEKLLPKPSKEIREGIKDAQLILVTSQEIDELCEQDNINQARRQMDGILNDIRRGLRILVDQGIQRIILASDHGHLFGEELSDDKKIEPPGGETIFLHRRIWVGHGGSVNDAFLRLPIKLFYNQGEFDLATPLSFACFKCKGGARAYFHGGLSPQELLIPVMSLIPSAKRSLATSARINWKLIPGSQKLSTRFFSIQIVGEIIGLFEIEPPRVRVEIRAKEKVISQVVSASYGFDADTGDVVLRVDEKDNKKIEPNTVTLMVTGETGQKSVNLYLIDAKTGVEISRLEQIEVTISI